MFRWILFFLFVILAEVYAYQAFRTITRSYWFLAGYITASLLVDFFVIYQFTQFDRAVGQTRLTLLTLGLLLVTFLPKLVVFLVLFTEDVVRVVIGLTRWAAGTQQESFFIERRKFVSAIALGLAAVPFLSLAYGMVRGKYNFRVIRQPLEFDDLPDSFDGLTITHISDIHSGSFDNPDKIRYAIDLINQQQSDVVLFTGDIVNAKADEMHPWIDIFRNIHSPEFGKFSVLGNHDYGEYLDWKSQREKVENFEAIKDLHRQIDFTLLLNEHVLLKKGNDRLAIVGVENWGHNFKKAGDLAKAANGLSASDFKILMSHDPSHWEHQVKNHPDHFQLTLSGHTHGMQFGIEVPGIKWSPVQYFYKQWAGLYENLGRYVYVNRGFGFHAYPGRVGIWPEITVLELKKRRNIA
jgi:predicted MPP superfamily phosphohydrolase